MNIFKTLFFFFSMVLSLAASAQRMPVPVMDFKDIPVTTSTNKALTAEQVGNAIRAAAIYEHWEIIQLADGVFQAKFDKESKHIVIVTINYDANKYSVTYKDSTNMKFSHSTDSLTTIVYNGGPSALAPNMESEAVIKQRALYRNNTDTPYGVAEKAVIHPYYEMWVHTLLKGIRRQLQMIQ